MEHLKTDLTGNNILVVNIDCADSSANKLSSPLLAEAESVLKATERNNDINALVITSAKPDTFIAGADLQEVIQMKSEQEVITYLAKANAILDRLAAWPKPVICAIHGSCIGGGLELALVADYRIASDSSKTQFALPEVKLGLFPAAGGTMRLPKLIGLPEALPLLLAGKQIRVQKAKKIGLINEIAPAHGMIEAAIKVAINLSRSKSIKRRIKRPLINKFIESNRLTRRIVFNQARKGVLKQTKGLYPAPLEIIESIGDGYNKGVKAGIQKDIKRFTKLVLSKESNALTGLFIALTNKKKNPLQEKASNVRKIGVLGSGFMGNGIAGVSTDLVDTIVLKDISLEETAKGIKEVTKGLNIREKSGGITAFKRDILAAKLVPCRDYKAFKGSDIVFEAVFEDLKLKRKILKDVEKETGENTIFASNTSSLPIAEIAKGCKRPENVIGMHYFSPVRSMPLLEIIVSDQTAEWVTATAIDFGIKQGKTVIVVNDGPAFYTTRILTMMLNEALLLVEEGVACHTIDNAMMRFGYPVGPITLVDEVGMDVGVHVSGVMQASMQHREINSSKVLAKLVEQGFLGRKNNKGFYIYDGSKGRKPVNPEVSNILETKPSANITIEELQHRVSLTMVNEAALCLQEGIISTPEDGDLGAVLGLGFPPFRGGPFTYVDSTGADVIVSILEKLAEKYGPRFFPAKILQEMATRKKRFYNATISN